MERLVSFVGSWIALRGVSTVSDGPVPSPSYDGTVVSYGVIWSVLFGLLGVLALVLLVEKIARKRPVSMKARLSLLFICLFSIIKCVKYALRASNTLPTSNVGATLLFYVPEGFLCSCFSIILFHWAQVLHRMFRNQGLLRALRVALLAINALLYLMLIMIAIITGILQSEQDETAVDIAVWHRWYGVGNLALTLFDVCTALGFFVYGRKLFGMQRQLSLSAKLRSMILQIFVSAVVSTTCLLVQAIVLLVEGVWLLSLGAFPTGSDINTEPWFILYMLRLVELASGTMLLLIAASATGTLWGGSSTGSGGMASGGTGGGSGRRGTVDDDEDMADGETDPARISMPPARPLGSWQDSPGFASGTTPFVTPPNAAEAAPSAQVPLPP